MDAKTQQRPRVLVAGGGIGALEAVLAVRELAGDNVHIELIAPEASFEYRPMSVAEPFGYERAQTVPLARLRRTHGVVHRRQILAAVHPDTHEVVLGDESLVRYDALILALGARPEAWHPGAVTFTGPRAVGRVRATLEDIEAGAITSVCFAASDSGWTLPVFELALLTAGWCAEHHIAEVQLTITTPEDAPLERFGRAATEMITELLADRGIAIVTGSPVPVAADAVITLPHLRRSPLPGVPSGVDGFIAIDDHCAIPGLDGVFAIGDCAEGPVKQGGLATQQADVAAAAIANRLGAPVTPEPYHPVLRGLLLTGLAPAYIRRDGDGTSEAAFDALWWPPTKVAGRFLGPYLAAAGETLVDRPAPTDPERAARDRSEVRELAISLARAEARWGDEAQAARWLDAVERLDGVLPDELAALRPSSR